MVDRIRALLAEMADELDHNRRCLLDDASLTDPLADRARAVLAAAQPAPVPEPVAWCRSDKFANAMQRGGSFHGWKYPGTGPNRCDMPLYAQAHPTPPAPVPVAVSERLPQPEDCAPWPDDPDVEPWCWAGVIVDDGWEWHQRSSGIFTFTWPSHTPSYTHWLPASALPLPTTEATE